ncbi:MAG: hypothetical protein II852_17705 [Bacteroidales bacterium]|nr:hypothetical protein [Bacteroidales bacterium]
MSKVWNMPDLNAAFEVVNRQLMVYHYKDDYQRYQELCRKRAALSLKIFVRNRRKRTIDSGIEDNYNSPYNINILKNF